MQTEAGAEQPIRRRRGTGLEETTPRLSGTTEGRQRLLLFATATALLQTISPQFNLSTNHNTAKMADDEDRVTMPFKFVTGMHPPRRHNIELNAD